LSDDKTVLEAADKAYKLLTDSGIGVLYDDRSARPGEMFADADLIGLPYRVVVSEKTLQKGSLEIKLRTASQVQLVPLHSLAKALQDWYNLGSAKIERGNP